MSVAYEIQSQLLCYLCF